MACPVLKRGMATFKGRTRGFFGVELTSEVRKLKSHGLKKTAQPHIN